MLNTGIYDLTQLSKPSNFKNLLGADRRVSITLYDQILQLANAQALAERILLTFTDTRGAYKRTYAKRFADFDRAVIKLLQQHFAANDSPNDPLIVQDVGISDGRTAVDFFEALQVIAPNVNYYASDYDPKVLVLADRALKVTLGSDGRVIEITWPPFVFNAARPDRYYHAPLNRIVQFAVEKLLVPKILRAYRAGKIPVREIYLFAPAVLALSKRDLRFKLLQHDILTNFAQPSDVIRAMNVLNHSYFSQAEFARIIANFHTGLKANGLLITGSNQDSGSLVHGGVYQKTANGFKLLWSSGSGSPIHGQLSSTGGERGI